MKIELIIGISIFAVIAFVVLLFVDEMWTTTKERSGEVLNLTYSPGKTSTTTGVAMTPNGSGGVSAAPVVGVTTSNDEWIITATSNDTIYHIQTSEKLFYKVKVGDKIPFVSHYGKLTRILHRNVTVQ